MCLYHKVYLFCFSPRLYKHGIPCPEVVLLRKHVLIMSFIGKDQVPAPKLKNVVLKPDQWQSAYHQCVQVHCTCTCTCMCEHYYTKSTCICQMIHGQRVQVKGRLMMNNNTNNECTKSANPRCDLL